MTTGMAPCWNGRSTAAGLVVDPATVIRLSDHSQQPTESVLDQKLTYLSNTETDRPKERTACRKPYCAPSSSQHTLFLDLRRLLQERLFGGAVRPLIGLFAKGDTNHLHVR